MLNIKLPSNAFVFGFDIPELNEFISKMSLQVYVFWTRIVNIDISEINELPKP